jgi:hypothetical protein
MFRKHAVGLFWKKDTAISIQNYYNPVFDFLPDRFDSKTGKIVSFLIHPAQKIQSDTSWVGQR